MMGTQARLFTPISISSLDDLVPADHFYRQLDRILDLSFVRELVRATYAEMGRPSIDPVVFFKLQLVMFFEGIRSERQLVRLGADRLSVRWYLGFNLDESLPDHSSLTRIRARYGVAVFRRFFEAIVEQCQQAGLVWGRELYFDATHVHANAALDSLTARFAVDARAAQRGQHSSAHEEAVHGARQAVEAHLAALFPAGDVAATESAVRCAPTPTPLPLQLSAAQCAELESANAARHDWIAEEGRQQRAVRGVYQRTADLRVSTTDPDATPMRLKGGGTHLGYQTHYVVDGGRKRVILGVLVAPGEVMENQPMLDLLWQARFRWKLRVRQVTGDTKYGTVHNIRAVEDMGIRAYIPLPDWEQNSPYFGAAKFTYDAEHDHYVCPNRAVICRTHTDEARQRVLYRAPAATCRICPLKPQCTPATKTGRAIYRSFGEEYLERVQTYQSTAAYHKALRKRQVWVEPFFAEAKAWHGLRRFRLRGLWRVNCEALLTAAGQNLKRLLAKQGWGRRPLPSVAALAVTRSHCLVVGRGWGVVPSERHHGRARRAPNARPTLIAA
jgi:transposase